MESKSATIVKKQGVGIILTNDEILLMQRGPMARSQHGKWELCGGQIEPSDKTAEAACERELKEE